MRSWFILLLILFPMPSVAAVLINEIAWMGAATSANHEWIELHNTGSAVVVDGWTLSDGMNLTINLTGTIPANAYVVLERTSDESAPGSAFLLYTGALVNTGATLTVRRADGGIEDQVGGGENWQSIGGDNVTKETAQYTSSGWITAMATPGMVNRSGGSAPVTPTPPVPSPSTPASPKATSSANSGRDKSETVRFILPKHSLQLTVDAQKVGYVNQAITFEAEPTGLGRSLTHSIVYRWNFGDGNVAFGKNPTHHYQFPGTYVVTLYASVGTQEHLSRHEITILPITLSVTTNESGDVQVNNDSPYEIDISGYTVRGTTEFVFPAYSIMLPKQTITIPRHIVGHTSSAPLPVLYDSLRQYIPIKPATTALLTSAPMVESSDARTDIVTPLRRPAIKIPAPSTGQFGFATTATATVSSLPVVATSTATTTTLSEVPSTTTPLTLWPYIAFAGVLGLCLVALFFKPKE